MSDFEQFWAEADRRYAADRRRVAIGTITAAVSVQSYSVMFPGDTQDRAGIAAVTDQAPQVNDLVRVEFVGDQPTIIDIVGGPASQTGAVAFTLAGGAGTFPSGTVAAAASGTVTFPVPYTVAPMVQLTPKIGGNVDTAADLTSDPTLAGFAWRVFARDPGTSFNGGAGLLHWHAVGR